MTDNRQDRLDENEQDEQMESQPNDSESERPQLQPETTNSPNQQQQ